MSAHASERRGGACSERMLRIIALAVMVAYPGIHLALSPPHLFADGTDFFLGLLNQKGFHIWDKPRMFAQLLTQFPTVLALGSGIRGVGTLGMIFGGSLLLVPSLLWIAAASLHLQTQYFWNVATAYAIVYLPTSLFAIGEFNVCYAINALVLALLLVRPFRTPHATLAALLSIANILTYPSNVLLAPAVIALLLCKLDPTWGSWLVGPENAARDSRQTLIKGCLLVAVVAYSSAFLISLWVNLFPRDASMASAARDPRNLGLYSGLLIGGILSGWIPRVKAKTVALLWMSLAALDLLWLPFLMRALIETPENAYTLRTAIALGLLLCLVVQPIQMQRHALRFASDRRLLQSGFCCLLVLVLAGTGLIRANAFRHWLQDYRKELAVIENEVPINLTRLPESPYYKFNWGWNNFQLSRILDPMGGKLILNATDRVGWQPDRSLLPMLSTQGYHP